MYCLICELKPPPGIGFDLKRVYVLALSFVSNTQIITEGVLLNKPKSKNSAQ